MTSRTQQAILKHIDFIFKKFSILIIVSFSLLVLFKNSIEDIIDNTIVSTYLNKIKSGSIPLWTIYGVCLLILLYFIRKLILKYEYSYRFIFTASISMFIYIYYRFFEYRWDFITITQEGYVAYLDLIPFSIFCILIVKLYSNDKLIRNKLESNIGIINIKLKSNIRIVKVKFHSFIITNSNDNSSKTLSLNDDYLKIDEDEKFLFSNRKGKAIKLARTISQTVSEDSYTIGIVSPWGNGKTTFLNHLIEKIKIVDENSIIINYSPWFCKSDKDITEMFIKTLANSLKNYHSRLNYELIKYSKTLINVDKSITTELIGKLFSAFEEKQDVKSQYIKVKECIEELDRKIYIAIDDLDRLHSKEIIECFKIIRNTANFKNVIYLIAYDDAYIKSQIKDSYIKDIKYIEKIVQLEYSLPLIEETEIEEHIKQYLTDKCPSFSDNIMNIFSVNGSLSISDYFLNIRSCNLVLRKFFTNLNDIESEIDLTDLFLICIFKHIYPSLALELYLELDNYFTFEKEVSYKNINSPTYWEDRQIKEGKAENKIPIFKIDSYRQDLKLMNLIKAIFFNEKTNIRSAALNHNYYTYYNASLPKHYITYKQFENGIGNLESLFSLIDTSCSNQIEDLFNKLISLTSINTCKESIIIQGLLYMRQKQLYFYNSEKNKRYINDGDIINKIKNLDYNFEILQYIAYFGDKKILYDIARLIYNIKYTYIKTSSTCVMIPQINTVEDRTNYDELLKKTENQLHYLSLSLLERILIEKTLINEIYGIYTSCVQRLEGDMLINIIDLKATVLMNDYIHKNPINFLKDHCKFIYKEDAQYIDQVFYNETGDFSGFEYFMNDIIGKNSSDKDLVVIKNKWIKFKKEYSVYLGIDAYNKKT
jgi:hypothetical protein